MEHEIRCKVFPGQFSSEYSVEGVQASGDPFSLFVPSEKVEVDEAPTRERPVDGWLKVGIWDLTGNRAVVKLPRESFESGRFVTVGMNQFKSAPQPVEFSQK